MTNSVGIIVDGDGDFASLRKRFPNGVKVVKTDGPRGESASARDIANKSRKQILILSAFKCRRVIVLLDFENRRAPWTEFLSELEAEFRALSFPVDVRVAIPNRMIENWYLADIEHLAKQKVYLREGVQQRQFEGKHGKTELKRLMRKGISYSETKHGPELFEILRFDIAQRNSPSFAHFIKQLTH